MFFREAEIISMIPEKNEKIEKVFVDKHFRNK